MATSPVSARIGDLLVGDGGRPLLMAGPCVIESRDLTLQIAEHIAALPVVRDHFSFVFKASYTKANRSSSSSYRGVGLDEGLRVLAEVRSQIGCPVVSDVHETSEAAPAGEVLDVIQVPAFLARQTALLEAAANTGKCVNVKKGQFMAPEDMQNVAGKVVSAGGNNLLFTERGTSFGYHNLVVDFRGFPKMRAVGHPVIFDVTHSLQRPAGLGDSSGGEPELAAMMARAAAAVPVDGLFIETHPDPSSALSDGASMIPLNELDSLLESTQAIFQQTRS